MLFRTSLRQEMAQIASATFVTLLTIVITTALIRTLGDAANGKVDRQTVLELIVFTTMNYLAVILVLTAFMAVIMVVSRAFHDREVTIWAASGLSLSAWIRPVLTFCLPVTLLALGFSTVITPWAKQQGLEIKQRYEKRSDVSKASVGQFRESVSGERIFFIERESADKGVVENVFIITRSADRTSIVVSKGGRIETQANGERFLVLRAGRRFDWLAGRTDFNALEFERYGIRLEPGFYLPPDTTIQTVSLPVLLATGTPGGRAELLWRLGLPLSCVFLCLLAIPLSFINPRAGRSLNLMFAVLVYLVYSNFLSIAQAWVLQKKMAFWPAFVLPHLLAVAVFGVLMYRRTRLPAIGWRQRLRFCLVRGAA
ncbi:MAG: LPS export ABC transporter permease LptF [Burkholderiaceae bacterium]|jgi:lipopolysaccharide export system permease protein